MSISNTTTNVNVLLLHEEKESLVFLEGTGEQSKNLANYLEVFKVLRDQIFASTIIPPNKDLCF